MYEDKFMIFFETSIRSAVGYENTAEAELSYKIREFVYSDEIQNILISHDLL